MVDNSKEGLPVITVTTSESLGTDNTILRRHSIGDIDISYMQYRLVETLAESAPNLVYASHLLRVSNGDQDRDMSIYGVPRHQLFVERMHQLFQPNLLGDHLALETHGPDIVGYRLNAKVNFVRTIQEQASSQSPLMQSPRGTGIFGRRRPSA